MWRRYGDTIVFRYRGGRLELSPRWLRLVGTVVLDGPQARCVARLPLGPTLFIVSLVTAWLFNGLAEEAVGVAVAISLVLLGWGAVRVGVERKRWRVALREVADLVLFER